MSKDKESRTATEILLNDRLAEKGRYITLLISHRLSIQRMLKNPIVKDVRAMLFEGGV